MTVVAWTLQIVLALAFLVTGALKLLRPRAVLVGTGMAWVEDFSDIAVKTLGVVEVLGAVGLILPAVTGVAPILVPLAAAGLALTMVAAIVVHARRQETVVPPLVLGLLAATLAVLRLLHPV